jgi:hypothetical protein
MSIDKFSYTLTYDICGEDAPESFSDFYEAVQYKSKTDGKARNTRTNGKMFARNARKARLSAYGGNSLRRMEGGC